MNFVDRIFDAPLLYTGVENLLGVYGYALQFIVTSRVIRIWRSVSLCCWDSASILLRLSLSIGYDYGVLASLAYLPFLLAERLSVYLLGWKPEGKDPYLYESANNDVVRRVMAWGLRQFHLVGSLARYSFGRA